MAFEHILLTLPGREANADLSNYQHRWVKGSDATAGKVAAIGSADDTAIGILQNAPAADGRAASVAGSMKSGARYIKNEASVAQGQLISVVLLGGALSTTN